MSISTKTAKFVHRKVEYTGMKQAYSDLDLIRLSAENSAVHLDKEFILIDNLDRSEVDTHTNIFFTNHPVKVSFVCVILCLAGRIWFRYNLQEIELCINDVLVVQEETIGEFLGMSEDARIVVMAFEPEYFRTASQVEAVMSIQRLLHNSPCFHLTDEKMEETLTIYRLMKAKILEKDNPFRKGALLGYAQVLAYNGYSQQFAVLSSENERPKEKTSRKQELYDRFIKEVQKSYTRERSISYYADVLCVTPKYLSQVIHHVSGRFASEWITDFVILEAKALLKSRKYSVQQIADMLHFANQSFFGAYFKRYTGCSPTAYKEM